MTASSFQTVSSKAESLLKARNEKIQYTPLVSTIINEGQDISYLPQIKWGTDQENDDIKDFMPDIAPQHVGGLEGFRDFFFVGSPDRMFTCKFCTLATVEIKCHYNEDL